jgi:Tfp pilus assembly protein PilN
MINLLPPETKKGYRYARRNVGLRRWVVIFLITFVGLGVIATYGLLTLHQSTSHYNQQIATNQALLKKQDYTGTQKRVLDISNSFKLVVQVLGREILFSQLLRQIGSVMPRDASLTGLNIIQTQGGLDITAIATDYSTATQVQVNLADPANKIFSKADIVGIKCGADSIDPKYPCTVTIRALFAANNPYLLINSKAVKP